MWLKNRTFDEGKSRLFDSTAFHFNALRAMGHSMYDGASPGEVLAVIGRIVDRDTEGWYRSWREMAEFCEQLADKSSDKVSKGNAYLRASNYYRASEFFIFAPDDRKKKLYSKSVEMFQKGIENLGIRHKIWYVPYDKGKMRVYYFPGDASKPLLMACNGFDGTNEESYFIMGAGAIRRGYPVILYEGPGQSSMIREYGIAFTRDWHRPVSQILDFAERREKELKDRKKILVGISLGGILAGRAAASEKRIDGVVLWGNAFDMKNVVFEEMPESGTEAFEKGRKKDFNFGSNIAVKTAEVTKDVDLLWGMNHGKWVMGAETFYDYVAKIADFHLRDTAGQITGDVLALAGEKDHFSSINRQDKKHFKNARSFTFVTFPEKYGAASHCQLGATEQALLEIFKWIDEKGP